MSPARAAAGTLSDSAATSATTCLTISDLPAQPSGTLPLTGPVGKWLAGHGLLKESHCGPTMCSKGAFIKQEPPMNRLLILAPALLLALPAVAQDAPAVGYQNLWCHIAFTLTSTSIPTLPEADVAAARCRRRRRDARADRAARGQGSDRHGPQRHPAAPRGRDCQLHRGRLHRRAVRGGQDRARCQGGGADRRRRCRGDGRIHLR